MRRCGQFKAVVGGLLALAVSSAAFADTNLSLYGTPGFLEMPTARSLPDGQLTFTFGGFANGNRASLGFQAAPRLLAAFRYSRVGGFFADGSSLYDRSFDVSFVLLTETATRPALAIGLQDAVGTGVFGSEFLVASKRFGHVDFSVGLGWGRLGSRGALGSPFGSRPEPDVILGGQINYDQWFRGPVAPFGGLSWRVSDRLTALFEYSSDNYDVERGLGLIAPKRPLNFGLRWKLSDATSVTAGWLYGSEVSFQISSGLNPRRAPLPSGMEPALNTTSAGGGEDELRAALRDAGLLLQGLKTEGPKATLVIRNLRYGAFSQAVGRTARLAAAHLPEDVSEFSIVLEVERGLLASAAMIRRETLETGEFAVTPSSGSLAAISDALAVPLPDSAPEPRFVWGLAPYISVSLFDPDQPIRADLGLALSGRVEFGRGFVAAGVMQKRIVGNLDQLRGGGVSGLPPVRSDYPRYIAEGDPGISQLTLAHYGRPGRGIYARITGGYLEDMYGGLSGEVLWKPVDSRLGVGVEVNYARKRNYDRLFGFQDFDTVTGHLSAYYEIARGYHVEILAGRYLAGDVGATLAVSRRFANGWEIGAYATRTNVSFAEFGEGSYDKGLRIVAPLDWVRGRPTRNRVDTTFRSLARDGGARLHVPGRLYGLVRDADANSLEARQGRFWR